MDPTRRILLALASRAKEAQLRWHAGRAATRARGHLPGHDQAFAHHAQAQSCLIAALHAAEIPAGFRVYDVTLSRDPVQAAAQLQDLAAAHHPGGPIEAAHEPARLAYLAAYAEPVTAAEQRCAAALAELPAARRDRVIDLAETQARSTA